MRTGASFDAPPATGPFPVVIYHPDEPGGYEEDFVLFEFLASHGYVVLSTSYHCPDPSLIGDCGGPVYLRDMYFLHRFATLLGNADASHVAAMGPGKGGALAMQWAVEPDTPLDAVVGLDPEPQSWSAFQMLPPNPNHAVAALRFARQRSEVLQRPPDVRLEVAVSGLQHDDFVTNGILREAARPHRNEYDRVCRLTLLFFDAYLKKNSAALAELRQP
jgi:hypothetical protein